MEKEKLLELVKKANFHYQCNLSYAEAERFKNAVLDEVIKELKSLSARLGLFGYDESFSLESGIEIIEAMK